ncbi:hypothetical protein DYB32_000258 [Aphanomyces invadans]|uniref:Uncharacterized protein n=1 Tax=Aphanomyces invadans TaxID=157072 RepID=A0A418BAK1_9STRA|nr:hypothetical protein DYB32_000258 [Aphanomyces invadans]
MPFTAVFLDVTHREGEDNLLYSTNASNDAILRLRGMLAASAGACRTLFHECIAQASMTPDVHAAYVDDSDAALPLPHATITGHVSVVAYDIVGRSVLSSVESLSEGPERHLFFQHVARMRGEFAYAQTMHDMLRAKVVDQPHDLVQRVADPLHLNDDHELNTDEGDACLLSSRWSQFRPDPILCHPITQATARVQLNNREFWVIGYEWST